MGEGPRTPLKLHHSPRMFIAEDDSNALLVD